MQVSLPKKRKKEKKGFQLHVSPNDKCKKKKKKASSYMFPPMTNASCPAASLFIAPFTPVLHQGNFTCEWKAEH